MMASAARGFGTVVRTGVLRFFGSLGVAVGSSASSDWVAALRDFLAAGVGSDSVVLRLVPERREM